MPIRPLFLAFILLFAALQVSAMVNFKAGRESTLISGQVPADTTVELLVKYQMINPDDELCYRMPSQFDITLSSKSPSDGQYSVELPLQAFNEDCLYRYHSAQYHISGPSIEEYILLESPVSLGEQAHLLNANYTIPDITALQKIVCEFHSREMGLCEVEGTLPDSYLISPQNKNIEIHVFDSSDSSVDAPQTDTESSTDSGN